MPRAAANVVPNKVQSIQKVLKDGKGHSPKEWRVGGVDGLVLITRTGGGGVFYFFYRMAKQRKQQKYKIGTFGDVTLVQATQRALELRVQVGRGENPKAAKRRGMTFLEMATKFLAESPTLKDTTRSNYRYCLDKDVYPAIGHMPASDVTPDDVLDICRTIKKRGSDVQAQRTKTTIGGVYAWGIKERFVKQNPAKVVAAQAKKSIRKRTPTNDELSALWNGMDETGLSTEMKIILRLLILTGQRRSEVAGTQVSELDLDKGRWYIPGDKTVRGKFIAGRTKNGHDQTVYLSALATDLFKDAMKNCRVGDYLFPASPSPEKTRLPYFHGESVTMAMRRLRQHCGIDDLTVQDMRRGIGNWLKDNEYSRDVRDLMLNHVDGSVDSRHYSSGARMKDQCRAAWKAWADHVLKIVGEKKPDASKKRTSKRFVQTGTVRSTIGVSDLVSKVSQSD